MLRIAIVLVGLLLACDGQMVSQPLSTAELQKCTADLACSINYSNVFQTKLDNASHFLELEVELLRHQMNSVVQPLDSRIKSLEANSSLQTKSLDTTLQNVQTELAHDRESLGNLTRSLYTLNDDFHKETMVRYKDVHTLVLELNDARNDIVALQNTVNAILKNSNGTQFNLINTPQSTSQGTQSCPDKDKTIVDLQANLTYYMNAQATTQKALENVRALESFLQSQVVQLKANLTHVEGINRIKDKVIVNLQQQVKAAQGTPTTGPGSGSCGDALGMENGQIPDSAVVASESQAGYGPEHARLDNGQGWYTQEKTDTHDYLQIDTGSLHYITKVATQGAPCCDVMVTNYTLQFSKDGQKWHDYQQNCQREYFSGNTDGMTVVEHKLDIPIVGRYIRFNVADFKKDGQSNYVGMRVEVYGCGAATT